MGADQFVHDADDGDTNTYDGSKLIIFKERTYKANATIAAGELCALDIGSTVACDQVVLADDANTAKNACVGMALNAAVAGGNIRVMSHGIHPTGAADASVAKGDFIYVDDAVPGSCTLTGATRQRIGYALSDDDAAGAAKVYIAVPGIA